MIRILALIGLGLLLTAQTQASTISIDTFDVGPLNLTADSSTPTVSSTQSGLAPDVIGGEREVELNFISGPLGTAVDILAPTPGVFAQSNDVQVVSSSTLTYDGTGNAGLGGVDLLQGGLGIAFVFEVLVVDLDLGLTVTVTDTDSNTGSVFKDNLTAGTISYLFSESGFSGVNFASVDRISLLIDAPSSADLELDFFGVQVVPEPASVTMALSAAAFGGVLGLRRFRRRRAS